MLRNELTTTRRDLLLHAGVGLAALYGAADARAFEPVPKYLSEEHKVRPYQLPEVLRRADGAQVTTAAQWSSRREEILELFRTHVYGRSPGKPSKLTFGETRKDPAALGGAATLKQLTIRCEHEGRKHEFGLTLFLPNKRRPAPVFLLLNNRPPVNTDPTRQTKSGFWPAEEVITRGYGIAAIQVNEVAPDKADRFREGVIRLMEGERAERPPDAWKTIGA
ncbi:MAG: hypothetical protein ACO1SX_03370, partial [Actinomycetota bacterium]